MAPVGYQQSSNPAIEQLNKIQLLKAPFQFSASNRGLVWNSVVQSCMYPGG